MNRAICSTLIVTVTLWKAVLVLFISSDDAPLTMMIGQFPNTYTSEEDCKSFAAKETKNIAVMTKRVVPPGATIVEAKISCMNDETGEVT